MRPPAHLLAWLALAAACGSDSDDWVARSERSHTLVRSTIDAIPLRTDSIAAGSIRIELDSFQYQVGIEPRSDAEEFAIVRGGVLLESGWAVVGDLKRDRLVAISPTGRPIPFGRSGEGPEEFVETSALLSVDGQRLLVRDNGLFRESVLEIGPSGLRLIESRRFERQPDDVCLLEPDRVELDYDVMDERTLRRTDGQGEIVSIFGAPLVAGSNLLNVIASQGELLCLPEEDAVIYAATPGSVIRYDAGTGEPTWRRQLADYHPVKVEQKGDGILTTYAPPPERRGMYIASIIRLDHTTALLQLGVHLGTEVGPNKVELSQGPTDSRFIDLETGAEIGRQEGIPRFLARRGDQFLVTSDEPEPWVGLLRFRVVREP